MPRPTFDSVETYLDAQTPAARAALLRIRALFAEVFVGGEEHISYQIPAWRHSGTYALYSAGYTAHVGVYPVTAGVRDALGAELEPFLSGKATLRFPLDRPLPEALLRRVAEARLREMQARPAKRKG